MSERLNDVSFDMVDNAAMPIHVLGPDGIIIWANREELATMGYSPEEYIGKHISEFHEDQAVIGDILARLTRFETIKNFPARMKHADGSTVYVEITSSVQRDEDECFHHTLCFTSNVTSRVLVEVQRKIEHARRESLEELRIRNILQQKAGELKRLSLHLEREKQLKQSLLNRMFPPAVSSDLLRGVAAEPRFFPDVTIFFSDIVGFTDIAAKVKPCDVFALLNKIYTVMDLCASTMGVYKVETIGDGYMAAGGLQDPHQNHYEAIADFAFLVQAAVKIVKNPLSPQEPIKLRIGLHCGSVVAGIVGKLMPRYCLFGDTVNVASRMEATGEANRIHCSDDLASKLADSNLCCRGEMKVQGKGMMKTWWLDSVRDKPVLSLYSIAALQRRAEATFAEQPSDQAFYLEGLASSAVIQRSLAGISFETNNFDNDIDSIFDLRSMADLSEHLGSICGDESPRVGFQFHDQLREGIAGETSSEVDVFVPMEVAVLKQDSWFRRTSTCETEEPPPESWNAFPELDSPKRNPSDAESVASYEQGRGSEAH